MSALDWPALLATLEQQRAASQQEVADIDAVIATVRDRAGLKNGTGRGGAGKPSVGRRAKPTSSRPKAAGNGTPAKGGRGVRTDPALLERLRKLYEAGTSLSEITRATGKSESAIYTLASAGKWKRPKKPGPAAPPPKGEQLAGSVRCNHCGRMTDYDPCRGCGKKLTRSY